MINAGKYNKLITIYRTIVERDKDGFKNEVRIMVMQTYASVKTTRGMTIIKNDSDFEKAYTKTALAIPKVKSPSISTMAGFNFIFFITISYLLNSYPQCSQVSEPAGLVLPHQMQTRTRAEEFW